MYLRTYSRLDAIIKKVRLIETSFVLFSQVRRQGQTDIYKRGPCYTWPRHPLYVSRIFEARGRDANTKHRLTDGTRGARFSVQSFHGRDQSGGLPGVVINYDGISHTLGLGSFRCLRLIIFPAQQQPWTQM